MSVAISWAKKVKLAKCDISVSFPESSHTCTYFKCVKEDNGGAVLTYL